MALGKKEKSINLIPEDQREGSTGAKFTPLLIFAVIIVLELLLFLGLVLLSASNSNRIKKLETDIANETSIWQTNEPTATLIKSIKTKKTSYDQAVLKYSGMDKKLEKIRSSLPEGVSLTTLALTNEGKVALTGKSQNPDDAYQYYDILTKEKEVTSVSLDSVSKSGSDYLFTINFVLKTK